MKKYLLVLACMASVSHADCYIHVNSCEPGKVAVNQLFKDVNDPVIQTEPNRCLQRAREYLNYCHPRGVPGFAVATAFYYSAGVWKTAATVSSTASVIYTTNNASAWIPLQKNY